MPDNGLPVLAHIHYADPLDLKEWFEVVYFNGVWKSYDGSTTFENGETISNWRYASDVFANTEGSVFAASQLTSKYLELLPDFAEAQSQRSILDTFFEWAKGLSTETLVGETLRDTRNIK